MDIEYGLQGEEEGVLVTTQSWRDNGRSETKQLSSPFSVSIRCVVFILPNSFPIKALVITISRNGTVFSYFLTECRIRKICIHGFGERRE